MPPLQLSKITPAICLFHKNKAQGAFWVPCRERPAGQTPDVGALDVQSCLLCSLLTLPTVPGEHPEAGGRVVAGRLRRSEVPLVPGQLHQAGGEPAGLGGQQRQPGVSRQSQDFIFSSMIISKYFIIYFYSIKDLINLQLLCNLGDRFHFQQLDLRYTNCNTF